MPLYGWVGLAVMVLSEGGMLARIEPFWSWHTPIAWTGYILLVDAIVWKRRRSSWIRSSPAEFTFLAIASIPLWLLFEGYNDEALRFAERYAPEHLLLAVRDPETLLPRVRNAGTVFLGASSSVTFGDYMNGANHVLPTGGLARCYSGLSTLDFVRWTTYQRISPDAAFSVLDWTAYVIFIVVIGGIGTIEGPIIGVLIFYLMQTYLADFGAWYLILLGALAIVVMLFAPQGIWGFVAARYNLVLFPLRRRLANPKASRDTRRPLPSGAA